MKSKAFLGAAAILALSAGAAHAGQGYVGAGYGWGEAEIGGFEADADAWYLEGAVAGMASPGVGWQLDGGYADSEDSDGAFSATGHLNLRNSQHLLGGFVGVGEAGDEMFWSVGGEGELYLSQFTFAGAVGYVSADDLDADGWGGNIEGRLFVQDNLRLEAGVGIANIDFGGFDDDFVSFNAGGEYQLSHHPISFTAGYSHGEFDTINLETDTFSIGARWNFGGGTLMTRDRTGASLAGLSGLGGALGY